MHNSEHPCGAACGVGPARPSSSGGGGRIGGGGGGRARPGIGAAGWPQPARGTAGAAGPPGAARPHRQGAPGGWHAAKRDLPHAAAVRTRKLHVALRQFNPGATWLHRQVALGAYHSTCHIWSIVFPFQFCPNKSTCNHESQGCASSPPPGVL